MCCGGGSEQSWGQGGFLPEEDPLEVGSEVKGVGRNCANLVILQVQVLKRWGEPFGDLSELIPSDVQQLQRGMGESTTHPTPAVWSAYQHTDFHQAIVCLHLMRTLVTGGA